MDNQNLDSEEVNLLDFFRLFWSGRYTIISITVISALLSAVFALQTDPVFTSSALLKHNTERDGGFNSGGGLASQILLGGQTNSSSESLTADQAIAYIRSREVIYEFFDKFDVRRKLYPLSWDNDQGKWKNEDDIEISEWKVYTKYISSNLQINFNQQTKIISILIRDKSPENTALYLKGLVELVNSKAKEKYLAKLDERINLLEESLDKSESYRTETLIKLLNESISNRVRAEANIEFLFKYLDYPVVPMQRSAPNRTLMTIIGTSSGFLISLMILLAMELFREKIESNE